ncbi:MAG: proteasome accessory factor PafA2 family protein, partial [Candidatus Caldarchaeum sp.]
SDRADWAAKKAILEQAATQAGKWEESSLQALDLEYHNINPRESLFGALVQMKRIRQLVNESRIADAMTTPPRDTRAMIRGTAIAHFKEAIRTVGWRRLIIKVNEQDHIVELPVTVGNRSIINSASSVEEWLSQLKSLENIR